MNDVTAKDPWSEHDRDRHMNELELLAALYALKSFTSLASRILVRLMMDDNTAVHYVNKSGGSRLEDLCRISSEIVECCEPRAISINAFYLLT